MLLSLGPPVRKQFAELLRRGERIHQRDLVKNNTEVFEEVHAAESAAAGQRIEQRSAGCPVVTAEEKRIASGKGDIAVEPLYLVRIKVAFTSAEDSLYTVELIKEILSRLVHLALGSVVAALLALLFPALLDFSKFL